MLLLFHPLLTFFGISLMEFQGCHGFFLRHNSSGKCIYAGNLFWDNVIAKRYWAELVDNCLYQNASFRYLQSELVRNIAVGGNLGTSSYRRYQNRMFIYDGKNQKGELFGNSTSHRLKQTNAGSLVFYDKKVNSCVQPDAERKYIDLRKNECRPTAEQRFTFGSVTQYNTKMKDVHCSPIQHMVVEKARYGDFERNGVFNPAASSNAECDVLTSCKVKSLCSGTKNKSCDPTVGNNLLLPSVCSYDRTKELFTEYTCVDYYADPIKTVPKIRLTWSPNTGYVQIKDGLNWRYVKEDYWDKNRQRMLCEHFGFAATAENLIRRRQLPSKDGLKIATGDLICYSRGSKRTSCCAHLVPSTTRSTVSIPYVKCKMCDNHGLLQNRTRFPDSVFSGRDSHHYRNARFDGFGWCTATKRGETQFLLIDLQKEYHITKVVTMGNFGQTKWIGQYTMQYSHNRNFGNRREMEGNSNGFQASITRLDIYNVRHIKIQSTEKTDFCLRIELYGEAQRPAPVKNVRIRASNYFARVTLEMETSSSVSSYIVKINVYLNGRKYQNVNRREFHGNFNIGRLAPNTVYNVGIETEDGSFQKSSRISKTIKTKTVPPGPPSEVRIISRTKNSLELSWKPPVKHLGYGVLTGYQICYSSSSGPATKNKRCTDQPISSSTYTITELEPATKYFVTVAAKNTAGLGEKSKEMNKILNGEAVNLVRYSSSSLNIPNLKQQAAYIKEVMIIVKRDTGEQTPVEGIRTSRLKPYSTRTANFYIAAYLDVGGLSSSFVIGDKKKYNFKGKEYLNQPLKQNTSYSVFLRFFESQSSFYSTEWSRSVLTSIKPSAPFEINFKSTAPEKYTIFWSLFLHVNQTVLKYHAFYGPTGGSKKELVIQTNMKSVEVDVDYETEYSFQICIATEVGKSDFASKSWLSHSEPILLEKETDGSYTLVLKKPESRDIKTVALVMLPVQSDSINPPAMETVKIKESSERAGKTGAFVAKQYSIREFKGSNTLEISLRKSERIERRKREEAEIYVLKVNTTYRCAQMNEDKFGNRSLSYWSKPFKFNIGETKNKDGKQIGERLCGKKIITTCCVDETTGGTFHSIVQGCNLTNEIVHDDRASDRQIRGTQSYLFGVTFVVGGIFGMMLSHIVRCFRRYLKRQKRQVSSEDPGTSTDKSGQNAIYESLDLAKMSCEDNYQSLRMDLNGKEEDTIEHEEPYTEMNEI